MPETELPAELLQLIDAAIASLDHVEVLRCLSLDPSEPVTVETLMARAHIDHLQATRVLRDLESGGIVTSAGGRVWYRPSAGNDRAIAMLMEAYNARPVTLVRAIHSRKNPRPSLRDVLDVTDDR